MSENGHTPRDKGCIYGLRVTGSDRYFYVGCTGIAVQERWKQHQEYIRAGLNRNRHFVNKVKKVGADNVVVDVLEEVATGLHEREKWWIEYLVANGHKLTNLVHNGYEQPIWHGASQKYSLRANWKWAQSWFADYESGVVLHPEKVEEHSLVLMAQGALADIIRQVLAAPEAEREQLIDKLDNYGTAAEV